MTTKNTKTMKTIDFVKHKGEISDVGALHGWLDRNIKWLMNGSYTLVLKRKSSPKRSLAQNRLMWMWFTCIEVETGQPREDIHDYYTLKFLPKDITDLATGTMVRVGGHTSTLTTEAFTDFLNKVQADAATELGITLPTPEDLVWEEFEEQYKPYLQ